MGVPLRLRSFREFKAAVAALGTQVERDSVKAMRKVARWGRSEVLKTSRATEPRPYAWGAYEAGWQVASKKDGAELVNTSKHSMFVEKGRRPNKPPPPMGPIVRWVMKKGMARRPSAAIPIARAIARKIGRKGIKPKWILARTMPRITARFRKEMEAVLARAAAAPPRR
jgi:hypothetical protein